MIYSDHALTLHICYEVKAQMSGAIEGLRW